jgi:transposase
MLPTTVRILVCTTPQDMRRSFDRLAVVVKESLREDPQSGALFVFVGKSATRAKVLWWDRNDTASSTSACTARSSRCRGPPTRAQLRCTSRRRRSPSYSRGRKRRRNDAQPLDGSIAA